MIPLWLIAGWEVLWLTLLRSAAVGLHLTSLEQFVSSAASRRGYDEWEKRGGLWWPKKG